MEEHGKAWIYGGIDFGEIEDFEVINRHLGNLESVFGGIHGCGNSTVRRSDRCLKLGGNDEKGLGMYCGASGGWDYVIGNFHLEGPCIQ